MDGKRPPLPEVRRPLGPDGGKPLGVDVRPLQLLSRRDPGDRVGRRVRRGGDPDVHVQHGVVAPEGVGAVEDHRAGNQGGLERARVACRVACSTWCVSSISFRFLEVTYD